MGDPWAWELAQRLGHENQEVSRRFDRFRHHITNFPGCISHELMSLTNKIQTFWYAFMWACHSVISIYPYKVPAPFRDCCKSGFGSPTAAVVHKGRQGPGHKGLVGYLLMLFAGSSGSLDPLQRYRFHGSLCFCEFQVLQLISPTKGKRSSLTWTKGIGMAS